MTMEALEEDLGDVDIEELESRLYSQVYHVNLEDQQCDLNASPNIVSKDEERNSQISNKLPESDNGQSLPTTRLELAVDQDGGSQNVSDEVNIVPARSSSKKKKNSQRAKKRYFFRKNMTDDEFFSRSRKSLERVKQRARKYDKLISILREKQHQNTPSKMNVVKTSDVITLSDSDGESCVEIPQPRPLVVVSDSEDEPQLAKIDIKQENENVDLETDSKEDGDEDDVIIIENPKPEVICIDEDIVEELSAELSVDREELRKSTEKLGEQNSSCALNEHQEEADNTPESNTSNDFLETTTNVEMQNKFNFSLHGTDFNNRDFIKPANPCEVYETGSSCSTSDFNPPLKPVVFNEVEFPREDLFSEGNMENFGALITPKRDATPKTSTKKSQTTSTQQSKSVSVTVNDSSGSSSESDYEGTASSGEKNRKKLPNLSNMDGNDITSGSEVGSCCESTKKSKKQKNSKRKSDAKDTLDDKPKKRRKSTSVTENRSADYCVEESSKNTSEKVESEESAGRNEPEDETQESKDNAEKTAPLDDFVVIDEINATVETSSIIDLDSENEALNDSIVDLQIVNCSTMKQTSSKGTVTSTPKGFSRKKFSETWSPNKIEFYSRSIDISQCEVENFLSTMSDDPELWQISQVDKNPVVLKRIGPRCLKCRNFGHTIQTCPTGDIICSTCAGVGHLYNRCTRNICRQCGKRIRFRDRWCYKCLQYKNKFCKLCRVRGHIEDMCPDLWRRYYLTTKHGPLKKPEGRQMKPASQLWCSSCANSGHLENSCYKSEGPQSVMSIKSYEDIYSSRDQPGSQEPNSRKDASNPRLINPKESSDNPVPVNNSLVKPNSMNSSISLPLLQQQTSQEQPVLKNFQVQRTFNPQYIPPLALALYNLANYPAISPVGVTNVQQNTYNNVAQTLSHNITNLTSNILRNNFGNQQSQDKQGRQYGFDHGNVGADMSETRAYHIIISKPLHVVKDFIKNELIKLTNLRCNAYVLRKKLSDLESLANNRSHDNLKECYREMNMLVFGVHRFKDGGKHLKTLRQLQGLKPNQRFDLPKRKMLWDSYDHIFGSTDHYSDYYNCYNLIIKEGNTAS